MFAGAFTAIITPFKDGGVDHDKLRELLDWQIEQGIDGIVPCGTTGESATLTHEEHREVALTVLKHVAGRVPVIAGTGSNSTAEAIGLTREAQELGADAALVITPYYNKPSQEGLFRHFDAVLGAVELPIYLYNVPSRTAVNLLPETVARLTNHPNLAGVKEASGDREQTRKIVETTKLSVLSGDDELTLDLMDVGARGVISVTANIAPADVAKMVALKAAGKSDEARKLSDKLQPLSEAMFLETNPQPVKTALKMLGKINGEMRLPMYGVSGETEKAVKKALTDYGLLKP